MKKFDKKHLNFDNLYWTSRVEIEDVEGVLLGFSS